MIEETLDQNRYSEFIKTCDKYNFLQSWEWGEFQISIGNKAIRYLYIQDDQILSAATMIIERTKLALFGIIPCGPIFQNLDSKVLSDLTTLLIDQSKLHHVDILRIAPYFDFNESFKNVFNKLHFKHSTAKTFANHSLILNLEPNEDALLQNMRKTTRYLIKQKERHNIEIVSSTDVQDVNLYSLIEKDTLKKHDFRPYSKDRIIKEIKAFSPNGCLIYKAIYEQEVVSMAIILFYGDEANYLYGASLSKYANIPCSYGIQWEAINEAKKRGCKRYNFWGISDQYINSDQKQTHPLWGVTQFKKGFGGTEKIHEIGFDKVLSIKGLAQRQLEKHRNKL